MIPKFRAWDKLTDTIQDVLDIKFIEKTVTVSQKDIVWYKHDNLRPFKGVILMQYTGLKDKNGVEIFEGDVVKVSDGGNEEDSYTSVVKNYADEGYPAFDIEAPSSWYYESNVLSTIMGGDYETIEVIGNVWEDGDLINDSEGAEEN